MTTNIVMCVGAPAPSTVTEASCTIRDFEKAFIDLYDLKSVPSTHYQDSQVIVDWRSLPLKRQALPCGLTQHHDFYVSQSQHHYPAFFTTASPNGVSQHSFTNETAEEALTQFCEASLSALEQTSFLSDGESFEDTSLFTNAGDPALRVSQKQVPIKGHLSDLEDVPLAKEITALVPSTVTLNLIVGILSIAQPRIVTTRWGRNMALIEILVGDETRSGFAITFWVPDNEVDESPISKLRRQDVAVIENVALHVFRGKVYGQSLRRGMTKVSVLWSQDGRGAYSSKVLEKSGKGHPQIIKTTAVRDWVLKFVGVDSRINTHKRRKLHDWDKPPDDSQDT